MLMDIWAGIGAFVSENYEAGLIVGLIIVAVAAMAQYLINASLEEDLIELVERVETMEKLCGIVGEEVGSTGENSGSSGSSKDPEKDRKKEG